MKYYVIEISKGDGRIAGKAVYEYDTRKAAVAAFHQKLAVAMNSPLYTFDMIMVTDDYGNRIEFARYDADETED